MLHNLSCSLGDDLCELEHHDADILVGSDHYRGAVTGKNSSSELHPDSVGNYVWIGGPKKE